MPTAPAADQQRLLTVQDLDTRAQQARHRRATLPVLADLASLEDRVAALEERIALGVTEAGDIRREVTKAEDDVQAVRARAQRDTARLESGDASAKDLTALQSELEVLARRQAELEDVELEAMERLEQAEAAVAAARAELEEARAAQGRLATERDRALAEIDAELAGLAAEREAASAGLDAALLALYEKLAAQHGGVGAAPLAGGACQGCHMDINAAELASIAKAPADLVVRCDECGRILVRPV